MSKPSPITAYLFAILQSLTSLPAQDPGQHEKAQHAAALATLQGNDQEELKAAFEVLRQARSATELHLAAPAPIGPRCAIAISGNPPVPIAALRAAAEDPSPYVRQLAAPAVGGLEGRAADAILTQLTVDPDATVRELAWQTLASRFAANPGEHADLAPLLQNRLERPIGDYTRAGFDELGRRAAITKQLHPAREAARALFAAVLDLPSPEQFWLALEVDKVRSQALAGLLAMGPQAQPVLPDLIRHLQADAWGLNLRKQGLEILRSLNAPHAAEAEAAVCHRAYRYALAAQPIKGLQEGYQRYFRTQQNQLIEAAVRGLIATGDASMLAELHAGAHSIANTVMLAARVRRSPWSSELTAEANAALAELGNDPTAQESTLLDAVTDRICADDCPSELRRKLLATCERFAGKRRLQTRPHHYLHAPSIEALRRVGPTLAKGPRTELVDRLIQAGNFPAADSTALAALCVDIDQHLASQRRDRGLVGDYLHARLAHAAPHLLVADLASDKDGVRKHAAQTLRTYGRATSATHQQFRLLLERKRLPDARSVLSLLTRIEPPTTLEPLLARWLDKQPQAYAVLGAMRPVRVAAMRDVLQSITTHSPNGEPTRAAVTRLRELLTGIKKLRGRGVPYLPVLQELMRNDPWTTYYVCDALPHLGSQGLEAFLAIEESLRGPASYAIRRALDADAEAQLKVLAFLMQRSEPVDDLADTVRPCLRSKDVRVLRRARMLLAKLAPRSPATTDAMLQCLSYDRELRHFATRTLASNASDPRVAAYLHWLQFDDDPFVERVARNALR